MTAGQPNRAEAMTDKKNDKNGGQSQVILETRPRTKKPSMYKVIMLNDDYTPMEFVVYVLQRFFGMSNAGDGDHAECPSARRRCVRHLQL